MADQRDQIGQVLTTLASHAPLISEGLEGSVQLGDKSRDKAIDALVSIHALIPYEEGAYRLNPRLREFITDHLVSYSAFQSLTRLAPLIYRTSTLWQTLKELRTVGKPADIDKLEWAIDDTVTEIVYAVERNLMLLNSQISTDYGNVGSIQAKLAQNRHYRREVSSSLLELRQVDCTADEIDSEALSLGNLQVRHLVSSRLRARLGHWVARLNDIQAIISKKLFWANQMEQRLLHLARAAAWLSQNKTSSGFDIHIDPSCPPALLQPEPLRVRPQLDVQDTDPLVWDMLVAAVGKMPAPHVGEQATQAPEIQRVRATETAPIVVESDPVDEMIDQIAEALYTRATPALSLIHWKRQHTALATVSDEEWLVYAATQLGTLGFKTEFMMTPRQASQHNDLFEDVTVYAPA
jgi:hypothetical protein